jgi:hypothetical protein
MQDGYYKSTQDHRQAERRGHFAEHTAGAAPQIKLI